MNLYHFILNLILLSALAACNGGGGGSTETPSANTDPGTTTGTAGGGGTSFLPPSLSFSESTGNSIVLGAPFSITPSLLENNGDEIIQCEIKTGTTPLPSGIYIHPSTCVISGTPINPLSPTTFTIVAGNANGNSTDALITLEVINASVPSLSYANSTGKIGVVGQPMSILPSLLYPNGAPVTSCSIQTGTTGLPDSLTINPSTCEIYGTPTSVYVSSYEFKIIASNIAGSSIVATINIRINPAAPTAGSMSINSGNNYTTSTSVLITLNATNASQMYITNSAGCSSGGLWEPYTTTRAWTITQANTLATVYAKFRNDIGDETECISDVITHDNIAPTGTSISINGGAASTSSTSVTLSLAAIDANVMYVTNTAGCTNGGIWENYAISKEWTIGQVNSTATVYTKYKDVAGNESACISDTIVHNSTVLSAASILINSNQLYTKATNVTLAILAISANEMYVTNTSSCASGGIWEAYSTTKAWTLGQTNSTATVYVKFRNSVGNESACISDSIIHDDIAPTATTISIHNGAIATNLTNVNISLNATSATEMYISNLLGCSSGGTWENYGSSRAWSLAQSNTTATVYVKFRDAAGNESLCISDSINHDDIAPTGSAVYIAGNNLYTNSNNVQIALNSNGSSQMYITNTSGCGSGGNWETFNQTKNNWILAQTNSIATVYAKFRDQAGNESLCINDTIIHDNTPPAVASIRINNGNSYTNTTNVTLALNSDEGTQFYVTNTSNCSSGGVWESFATSKNWTLNQTNAVATVYVRFKDTAGNFSPCISDTITHDNIAPTLNSLVINNGASHAFLNTVNLNHSSTGASEMYITNYSGCTSDGIWEPYLQSKKWTLGQANSTATVYTKYRDLAGNETPCVNDSIIQKNVPINFLPEDTGQMLSNNVQSIFVENGTWYVATDLGISISGNNGSSFINKTLKNGLGSNNTNKIKFLSDKLYVATAAGLSISSDNGNSFQTFTTSNGLGSNTINDFFVLNNKLFVATTNGLSISNGTGGIFNNYLSGSNVFEIKIDSNNFIYLATLNGVYVSYDNGSTFILKTTSNGLRNIQTRGICIGSDGQILAATGGGISVSNDNANSFYDMNINTTTTSYTNIQVYDIECEGNNIFLNSNNGFFISPDKGASFSLFSTQQGLLGSINDIYLSSDKKAYISQSGGISITSNLGGSFTNYSSSNGIGSSYIKDIFVTSQNYLYISTTNGTFSSSNNNFNNNYSGGYTQKNIGTYIHEGSSLYSISSSTYIYKNNSRLNTNNVSGTIYDLFIDNQNTIYVASGTGLSISHVGNEVSGTQYFSKLTTVNGLGSNIINKIFVNTANKSFIATSGGLSISSTHSVFNNKTTLHGLGSNNVYSVFVDPATGYIYAGTSGGLSISTNGGTSFSNKNSTSGITTNIIRDIFVDSSGRIILATDRGVQISFDSGQSFITLDQEVGLCGNNVLSLFTKNSIIYVGTVTGACSFVL